MVKLNHTPSTPDGIWMHVNHQWRLSFEWNLSTIRFIYDVREKLTRDTWKSKFPLDIFPQRHKSPDGYWIFNNGKWLAWDGNEYSLEDSIELFEFHEKLLLNYSANQSKQNNLDNS
jgi:hypothetical protein|tara:strand:+ start:166 stop:513 length:348 start_codon:yes stop_codon:yes gene_type:complete